MSGTVRPLTLYDLLAPEFLAGFSFPSYIDQYLSLLVVKELTMTSDAGAGAAYTGGVVYTGTVAFPSAPGSPPPVTQHTDPSGAVFNWNDISFQFRLRTWRNGSGALQSVVIAPVISSLGLGTYFSNFTPAKTGPLTNSDYPGLQFRLELLVSLLTFHMGNDWSPGKMDANYHVVKDTTSAAVDVEILLPKITLVYEQPEDFSQAPSFSLAAWGNSGFDAPSNLGAGELVTMNPPLALHSSGRVAFSVQNILLDLTPGATPPELLGLFGIGDDFTGVYIQQLQFFYSDPDKDFAFNVLVTDAVISFQGQVWLQAELDLTLDPASHTPVPPAGPNANQLQVTIAFVAGGVPVAFNDSVPVDGQPGTFQGGTVSAPPNVVIQPQVTGGTTPYTYALTFTPKGGADVDLWDATNNQGHFTTPPTTTQSGTLVIKITDAGSLVYTNTMLMTVATITGNLPNGAPQDSTVNATVALAILTLDNASDLPAGYAINFTPSTDSTVETLVAIGGQAPPTASLTPSGGASTPVQVSSSGQILIEVDPGQTANFSIVFPAQTNVPDSFTLLFNLDGPQADNAVSSYVAGAPSPEDPIFTGNVVPAGTPVSAATLGLAQTGANALVGWMKAALDQTQLDSIQISATDSYEGYSDRTQLSQTLSQRRLDVARGIIGAAFPALTVPAGTADGCTAAQGASRISDPTDRAAVISGTAVQGQAAVTITGSIARAASAAQQAAAQQAATPPPQTPPAGSNSSKPVSLKRLSLNVRIEKNLPVLLEISGEIDFQQQTQQALPAQSGSGNTLGLTSPNGASPNASTANPQAAATVVDFTLTVTYDPATCDLTEMLTLGAGPADTTGLLQMKNGPAGSYDPFKNIFGALMIFTPIINAVTTAIAPGSAGEWADIGVSVSVAATIGGLGWINTSLITLYGGSLVTRQNVPSGLGSGKFTYAALTFDYGVSFRIDIDPLGIHSSRDLSVRYDAFGFSLDFSGAPPFQFVFDTSKGYTLDLSDPSLFKLPGGLGDLLKIAEARIAQFNPLTIEADLVMKVDLGVITIDAFQVKAPLNGSMPMILPSGIHVNLPDIITGGGSVNISQSGFEGGFDLTLVPLSLRIAAQVGIQQIPGPPQSATAVFLSMEVDFPTPIILGTSGLGIFGFFGLFAMHYGRNLPTVSPDDVIGPNLQWLINAGGQPQLLFYPPTGGPPPNAPPTDPSTPTTTTQNWVPQIGSWAFGVGALLGTIDGFLLTLRGMFILELPGPEIIITVNVQVLADLPGEGDDGVDTVSIQAGMLGILDLNFELGQITLGISINLEVEELISISVPISIFFSWDDPDTWHVWLGTISTPISANILGIVVASGYFMIGGQAITPFPPSTSFSLPGVAVAVGFSASIIWGSQDIDIYLEVVVGADLGVSFSPHLFIAGDIHLSGKLELLIISIGASGDFTLVVPDPFYLHVKVCGSVSFFFFSISGCVEFGTSGTFAPVPPPLISQMYLQSYAPVIPSGQGGSRPIDASLGSAAMTVASNLSTLPPTAAASNLAVVPIDTVPVLQFSYGADASQIGTNTFTASVPQCAMLPTSAGGAAISLGGGRTATYTITGLTISPPLPTGTPKPPVVWRKNTSQNNQTATRVDLALFSRDPNLASHALERSTTLNQQLNAIWGGTCTPVAPAACVLWTFCGQNPGPSDAGWALVGIAEPDPPNTSRTAPPPTLLQVTGPVLANATQLFAALGPRLGSFGFQPAQVIGVASDSYRNRCDEALELPELIVTALLHDGEKGLIETFGREALTAIHQIEARLLVLAENWRWVRLETGQAARVGLYLAVHPLFVRPSNYAAADALASNALLRAARELSTLDVPSTAHPAGVAYNVVVRERNAAGTLLREQLLGSLNPTLVTGTIGLPSEWTDPSGPWFAEIYPLSLFMESRLPALAKLYVSFAPLAETTTIEIAEIGPVLPAPTVVIGAVEVCSLAEAQRAAIGQQVQASQISTLEGYLDGGSPVPLLAPDTTYTITVEYNVQTVEAGGATNTYNGVQQGFAFQTDSAPPPKLDPWVMSSTPANNALNVFFDDPVTIVFNDQEAIQLFKAYNYDLVLELHAADGLNDPTSSIKTTASVSNTVPVPGFGPAGYDSLLNLIEECKLPCVGAIASYQNQQFTADVTLRPCMAYTLDIVTNPATPQPANQPIVPLYRTRFTTSTYASLADLATGIGGSRVRHRHLSGPLTFNPPVSGTVTQRSDQEIETAFLSVGEQALPAAAENAITIYWIPGQGSGPYVPYALMIDCTEPLWRTRQEPKLVPANSNDPSFTIVKISSVTALEVQETGGNAVAHFVYSTSGTRTIAILASGSSGAQSVTLQLHRPASQVFGLSDSAATIIALEIDAHAPWEADHV